MLSGEDDGDDAEVEQMREILNEEGGTFMSISCSLGLLTHNFNHPFVAIVLDRNGCSGVKDRGVDPRPSAERDFSLF